MGRSPEETWEMLCGASESNAFVQLVPIVPAQKALTGLSLPIISTFSVKKQPFRSAERWFRSRGEAQRFGVPGCAQQVSSLEGGIAGENTQPRNLSFVIKIPRVELPGANRLGAYLNTELREEDIGLLASSQPSAGGGFKET